MQCGLNSKLIASQLSISYAVSWALACIMLGLASRLRRVYPSDVWCVTPLHCVLVHQSIRQQWVVMEPRDDQVWLQTHPRGHLTRGVFHVICQWYCILSSALVSVEVPFWFLTVFAISGEVLIFGPRVFVWCWSLYIAVVYDRADVLSWTQSRTLAEKITVWSARWRVWSRDSLPFDDEITPDWVLSIVSIFQGFVPLLRHHVS